MELRKETYERDPPEYLFNCSRNTFSWIRSLGCCKTDQFGAAKCKGCCYEDGAETFEAVVESAWVEPVFAADVFALGSTATIEDYA